MKHKRVTLPHLHISNHAYNARHSVLRKPATMSSYVQVKRTRDWAVCNSHASIIADPKRVSNLWHPTAVRNDTSPHTGVTVPLSLFTAYRCCPLALCQNSGHARKTSCTRSADPGVQPLLLGASPAQYWSSAIASCFRVLTNIYWDYRAVQPPSMERQAPVMDLASSLHKCLTRAAISSGSTNRLVGWSASKTSLMTFSCIRSACTMSHGLASIMSTNKPAESETSRWQSKQHTSEARSDVITCLMI